MTPIQASFIAFGLAGMCAALWFALLMIAGSGLAAGHLPSVKLARWLVGCSVMTLALAATANALVAIGSTNVILRWLNWLTSALATVVMVRNFRHLGRK